MFIPFGELRPDISDLKGEHSVLLNNVLPRGDGYGPVKDFSALSSALPYACRGAFRFRKSDGSVMVFAATSKMLYLLNNTTYTWDPVSKHVAVTSISNASPAVVTYTAHGFAANDPVVFSTSGALPTGLTAGTTYYVKTVLTADTFTVSATAGGAAINTSGAGSGTHSVTANYTELPAADQWQFAAHGNYVITVQANSAPQYYLVGTSSAFADLAGSPPQAKYIAIVGRFVVLSGLTSNPFRIHWSGLNAPTTWTSGTNSSDYQDFSDGGIVRTVAGGETGTIFQDGAIRRMTYMPGSPPIFQIDRVTRDMGVYAPLSVITANNKIYFLATQGFHEMEPNGYPVPLGRERFDATFLDEFDAASMYLMIGVSDPRAGRVFWFYKTETGGTTGLFNKAICYDTVLRKPTTITGISGEYVYSVSQPGITLESLDSISSSIDALTQPLDSYESTTTPELGVFNSSHVLGLLRGNNLEATLETPEQGEPGDGRIFIRGVKPKTDAASVYALVKYRETAQATLTSSTETLVNAIGYCPQRVSARSARARVRIPASTVWTYAQGVDVDYGADGER